MVTITPPTGASERNGLVTLEKAEIRRRAVRFAQDWEGATSEQSDKQLFWQGFFHVFGKELRQVGSYEAIAQRASTGRIGWIDLLVPGQMAVEHKSAGSRLGLAMAQLLDYLPSLGAGLHPWLLVVSDFAHFEWHNLETGARGRFKLVDLADNLELFWWLAGYQIAHREYGDEVAANLSATRELADVYDALIESGYPATSAREWVTRILFCLFADDAGVWDDRGAFHTYLVLHTAPDGHDLGDVIQRVFKVLNASRDDRPGNLDEDLNQFTHINGDLFKDDLWAVSGNAALRDVLLKACSFDWSVISPAIFGSLFQNVITAKERRQLGAHYTSERDILRTIGPLLLDQLEAELAAASSARALEAFHDKLAGLTFFDPACGCGNFLVIAYRELRRLETATLRRLAEKRERTGQLALSLDLLAKVRVDHFYGIEIEEFPARIARTALYLMDHLENRRVSVEFGESYVRFPIPAAPHIHKSTNALRLDWNEILPAAECDYLLGNPPFAGQKTRTSEQTNDMKHVWGKDFARWLDYVSCWYRVAADYLADSDTKAAFVSTNSITQGEQVARIWRPLLARNIHLDFAHRRFAWTSEARGKAQVQVVIIGFSTGQPSGNGQIFDYPEPRGDSVRETVSRVNPYLLDGPDILVESLTRPLSPMLPIARYGNKPSDAGHLIIEDAADLPPKGDAAEKYIKPLLGAQELLHAEQRWCIWMEGPDPMAVNASIWLRKRLDAVQKFREVSTAADTKASATRPWRFFRVPQPTVPYIAIPRHVSENRQWFTVQHASPDVIAADSLFTVVDPDGFVFGLLSSAMFTAWLRTVGGALESRLRFSGPMVYNTFPFPRLEAGPRKRVTDAAAVLIDARARHTGTPLADLYNPLSVPSDILTAHRSLDIAVDRAFTARGRPSTVTDRMRLLFPAYDRMRKGEDPQLEV